MAHTSSQEIIDLTGSTPPSYTIVIDSSDDHPSPPRKASSRARKPEPTGTPSNAAGKDKRRKRNRAKSNKMKEPTEDGEIQDVSNQAVEKPHRRRSLLDRIEGVDLDNTNEVQSSKRRERWSKEKKRRRLERAKETAKEVEHSASPSTERRRSHSPDKRRSRSPAPRRPRSPDRRRGHSPDSGRRETNAPTPFFIDVKPVEVPELTRSPISIAKTETEPPVTTQELLLPPHVSVFGGDGVDPVEILAPSDGPSDEEDFIEHVDYDDDRRVGLQRYFDEVTEVKSKPVRVVCKHCGAEGDHKTSECTVQICLTCGVRNEHSTYSCPISKTCYTCGMKGHIGRTCPNRRGQGATNGSYGCDRCGSTNHKANECPTLWRMYEYVDDTERQNILRTREEKRTLPFGQGGEGYIAGDDWCYNCGGCGHFGDDCTNASHPHDFPRESSAFSVYNTLSGPFADAVRPQPAPRKAIWETASSFADETGFVLPHEVGKEGRRKERARMEQRAREIEQEEEDDDWFGRARNGGSGRSSGRKSGSGGGRGRVSLGNDDLPGPSRETDHFQIRGASRRDERRYSSGGGGPRYEQDRDFGHREERGPRYKGGYAYNR